MAISGLSRVRTKLFHLFVIQSLAPHPVEADRQLASHRHLGDPALSPHGEVDKTAFPIGVVTHRGLRRFYQQEAQQRVALFADVPQSPPLSARLFRRNQSYIAGDLLAAFEAFWCPDNQLES